MQQVTAQTQDCLSSLDCVITEEFLSLLLGDDLISPNCHPLMELPIKQYGMAPLTRLCTIHATSALQEGTPYCRKGHLQIIANSILYAKIQKDVLHGTSKEVVLLACSKFERRTIEPDIITGAWLTDMPTHDNSLMFSPGEWRNGCFLRYARTPPPRPTPSPQLMLCTVLS